MAKPFVGETFPGGAVGKGNAQVIQDSFEPDTAPPVDVADPSVTPPVEPDTEPAVDLAELLPTFPPEHFLGRSELPIEEMPEALTDFFDVV